MQLGWFIPFVDKRVGGRYNGYPSNTCHSWTH